MVQRSFIHFLAAVGFFAGMAVRFCESPQNQAALNSEPDFVGFITMIERTSGPDDTTGRIAVESHAGKMVRRQLVITTRRTAIFRQEGNATRPLDFDSLKAKDWVKVWFSENVKQPYPLQVAARQLVVSDRP